MMRVAVLVVAMLILGIATTARVSAQETVDVGVDTDPSGNTANSLGDVQDCRTVAVGDTFQVDVWVKGVPPLAGFSKGISAFGYNLLFDPSIIEVTAVDDHLLITSSGSSAPFEVIDADATAGTTTDPLPATSGNLRVDDLDLSMNAESGDGVLSRLTLKAIGAGQSGLTLSGEVVIAINSDQYKTSVNNGAIGVGENCSIPSPAASGLGASGAGQTPAASGATPITSRSPSPIPTGPAKAGGDSGLSTTTAIVIVLGGVAGASILVAGIWLGWGRFRRR